MHKINERTDLREYQNTYVSDVLILISKEIIKAMYFEYSNKSINFQVAVPI